MVYGRIESEGLEILIMDNFFRNFVVKGNRNSVVVRGGCGVKDFFLMKYYSMFVRLIGMI